MKVHYVSCLSDSSGYSNAARAYVDALLQTNQLDLSLQNFSFERERIENHLDSYAPYLKTTTNAPVQIIHLTPENYARVNRQNKYNIGYILINVRIFIIEVGIVIG